MVQRKQTGGSVKRPTRTAKGTTSKFSISIIHAMQYPTLETVKAGKASILRKVAHAKFTAPVKTSRGFKFLTKTTYVKALPSGLSAAAITAAIKNSSPGSKVSVKRVS